MAKIALEANLECAPMQKRRLLASWRRYLGAPGGNTSGREQGRPTEPQRGLAVLGAMTPLLKWILEGFRRIPNGARGRPCHG